MEGETSGHQVEQTGGSDGGTQGKKQMSCCREVKKKMKMKYKGTVTYGVVSVSRDLCPVINTQRLITVK